ncbi:Bacteriophage lambda, GpH, tail tape measure, N-terminal [uncultured Caudovirales phage]|uniref:Bacteriophage lambda, GpH, tail tape measure, N-terminal n=1 Tax=uncultured Caudovirales phage TaxID=2100421 RepID=A0A6J7XHD1_9CAUD|nr:Bacteriophage lambda, GpH, tail tape measure, N-terminal [uncultured Caudovirales phage]CAB4203920.1 Bacteriophage lambda, GpH, tail tape measure, N-terminal [uncultured Caudovirales phage]CAB5229721.1 Bacteriophage lambda, GpH, tail tape measure, N-terminal [uncultured Caudovirales phage]
MARQQEARLKLIADEASYVAGVKRAIASTDKFNRSTKRVNRNPFTSVTRSVAGLAGAYIGAQGLITVIQGAVREQQESVKVGRQTNAVLKSTKGAAGLTAKSIENLAQKLSEKTAVDDEAIQSAENLLLTFTKIGKDTFPTATQAVLDLSAATGTSLKGASIQVGKALQDPVKGITALRKVGVNFSADQTNVIKKLVDTGKTAEAQKLILQELATEFGGSAAAQATPLDRLRVTYQNLLETLGGYLVPVLNDVAEATIKFVDEFRAGAGAGGQFRDTLKGIYDTLKPIVQLLINHPALIAGVAAAYVAFKLTLGGLKLYSLIIQSFGSVGQYAAAGTTRGAAFSGALTSRVGKIGKIGAGASILGGMFAVKEYGPALDKWQQGVSGKIRASFPSFSRLGGDLIDALGTVTQGVPGLSSVGAAIKGARALAKASKGGFVSDGRAILNSLGLGGKQSASKLSDATRTAIAKAATAARRGAKAFPPIGRGISSGLAAGINSAVQSVVDAAVRAVNKARDAAKSASKQNSPSLVFAEIGAGLVEGMALGMSRTAPLAAAAKKMVKAATPSGGVKAADAFGLGSEVGAAEDLAAARRAVTNARNKKSRDKASKALAALEAKQAAKQARATAGETLKGFVEGIKDTIRTAELSRIMAPVNLARAERAGRETRAARGGLEAGITRAQAEASDPRVQARYQRDAARLDARMVQARKSGNLEAIDALQSEKDALDARYGPAYLAELRDQLAQLNENEIEASSEKAADDFVAQFSTGMDAALKALLGGGSVQAFFAQLTAAMTGSGVSPGSLPASVTAGAGEAAAVVAPAPLGSRITAYLRGKDKKKTYTASQIAAGLSPKSTKSAVFGLTGKEYGGYKIANRASGGMLTPGMLTMVGETGPELIMGGKVNSSTRTNRMGGGQGMNITVNAVGAAADDPMLLARQLGWQLATR